MPPKKKSEPSKKTVDKAKQKIVEDKTFGLKNKKGAKTQKYISTVEKTVLHGNKSAKQLAKEQEAKQSRKDEKKKAAEELNALFKPVEQKVSKGADPKSVLCAFYKAGQCKKGDKCKFSHDLNVGRKGEKRNVYDDAAEQEGMEDWDEEKLEDVVNKKHGEANKSMPATTIICKYFLEAVENLKYGWFWKCPNGEKCHYKHCLPPGFVLKRDQKKEEKMEEVSLEELIEKERAALNSGNLTKVTLQSFLQWKERKRKEKIQNATKAKEDRKKSFKMGKVLGVSGREMFEFNPDLVTGDEEADEEGGSNIDLSQFRQPEEDEATENVCDINETMYSELTENPSPAGERLSSDAGGKEQPEMLTNGALASDTQNDESSKLAMAAALPEDTAETEAEEAIALATAAVANGDLDIDENLFDGDDLLDIEQELETLELNE